MTLKLTQTSVVKTVSPYTGLIINSIVRCDMPYIGLKALLN